MTEEPVRSEPGDRVGAMSAPEDALSRPEVQWGVGCFVGATALLGLMIITLIVAFALTPPAWVQVLIGLGLVAGGVLFAWMIRNSLAATNGTDTGARSNRPERST